MEAVARTSTGPASESEAFLGRAGEAGGHRRVVNRPAGDERRRPSDAATPLAAMNGTLRDLCERVRDRLAELSGARPSRRVARVESCLPRSSRLNATSTPARAERSTDAFVGLPLHPLARALSSAQAETARLRTSPSSTPRCRRRSTTSTARSSSSASRGSLAGGDAATPPPVAAYPRLARQLAKDPPRALRGRAARAIGAVASPPSPSRLPARARRGGTLEVVERHRAFREGPPRRSVPRAHPPPAPSARPSPRGDFRAEALRDAPDDSENYHVSAGITPGNRRSSAAAAGETKGAAEGRGPRRGSSRRDVGPGMSPVIEETSPSAKEKETVGARGSDAGSRGSDAPPAEFARRSRSDRIRRSRSRRAGARRARGEPCLASGARSPRPRRTSSRCTAARSRSGPSASGCGRTRAWTSGVGARVERTVGPRAAAAAAASAAART